MAQTQFNATGAAPISVFVAACNGDGKEFTISDPASKTMSFLTNLVAREFDHHPRDFRLCLGVQLFAPDEAAMTLKDLGIDNGANLTLLKGPPRIFQTKQDTKDEMNEWYFSETLARVALYFDGSCLLAASYIKHDESSCHSGWDEIQIIDIARGTYEMDADGRVARCSWHKHLQRKFLEDHWVARQGTDSSTDSGWELMDAAASTKYQRIELENGAWETVREAVTTDGTHVLGVQITRACKYMPSVGDFPEAAKEILELLSWEGTFSREPKMARIA
jgi:hypothetical protein